MMSSWSGWRSTMVCAGWPSSQRNRLGTVTQTLPVATSGWDSILSDRVWVKSADQLCKLVCTANQRSNWASRSSAPRATEAARHNTATVQLTRLFLVIIILLSDSGERLRLGLRLRNRKTRRSDFTRILIVILLLLLLSDCGKRLGLRLRLRLRKRSAWRSDFTCPLARWERIDTIDLYPVESAARMHAGFAGSIPGGPRDRPTPCGHKQIPGAPSRRNRRAGGQSSPRSTRSPKPGPVPPPPAVLQTDGRTIPPARRPWPAGGRAISPGPPPPGAV